MAEMSEGNFSALWASQALVYPRYFFRGTDFIRSLSNASYNHGIPIRLRLMLEMVGCPTVLARPTREEKPCFLSRSHLPPKLHPRRMNLPN